MAISGLLPVRALAVFTQGHQSMAKSNKPSECPSDGCNTVVDVHFTGSAAISTWFCFGYNLSHCFHPLAHALLELQKADAIAPLEELAEMGYVLEP
jgi:hypothetical protein